MDAWYFVAATRDSATGELAVYVNGARTGSSVFSAVPNTQAVPLRIGMSYYVPSGEYFKGAIDDVRIYNRALSAQEIQQLYLGGASGPSM